MTLYVGNEIHDNSLYTSYNSSPKVIGLADGGYALAWSHSSRTIYTRAYDENGVAYGDSEGVAVVTAGGNAFGLPITIAAVSGGGYQLGWSTWLGDGDHYGVNQISLDSEGTVTGSSSVVNSTTASAQDYPAMVGTSNGGWLAAYTSWGAGPSGGYALAVRGFDANGDAITLAGSTNEFLANEDRTISPSNANIDVLASGRFVVTWDSYYNGPGSDDHYEVRQRVFEANGDAVTDDLQVNVYTTGVQSNSDVTGLKGGGYVVSWHGPGSADSDFGVYQQVFDADGVALFETDQLISTSTGGQQSETSIAALDNGGWVAVWTSNHGGDYEIYQKVFASDGSVLVDETVIASTTSGEKSQPNVAALEDGGWVVTWSAYQQFGAESTSIVHRRFGLTNEAPEGFDKTLKIKEDVPQTLSANYFGFSDDDGNAMKGVIISSLPTKGVLKLNGVAVTTDQMIDAADLGNLTYTPPANAFGTGLAKIGFKVVDDGGTAYDSVDTDASENYVTFNITDVVDVFNGTNANNTLTGTQGADRFLGMGGNDTLKGLGGIDTFTFRTGDDKDKIIGFDAVGADHDIINLAGLNSVTSWNDLRANHMSRSGADVVINGLNGDTITLSGVKLTDLDKGDFVF
ncbi:calcium-binding protein [Rhizobium alvei]|uniref:Calcium-binding protein n=1 Tax=Rhizobium alvei TaxID=1132659 RepID=A0ABT8YGQ1_9HYPH|nr:hypothetical protein [Rhizobium alvei]MDO6962855.1 hypothetical protein [Rhizobium alvei]